MVLPLLFLCWPITVMASANGGAGVLERTGFKKRHGAGVIDISRRLFCCILPCGLLSTVLSVFDCTIRDWYWF